MATLMKCQLILSLRQLSLCSDSVFVGWNAVALC